jgi:phage shock protein PspC (stress-responsive transcriptional regulator)
LAREECNEMSAQTFQSAFAPVKRHRAMVCGVCLRIADTTGLPVWVPRAGFVVLGIGHLVLATLVYVAAAAICHRRAAPTAPMARPAPYDWRDGPGLRDRFNRLDARLAAMEAEAAHSEAALRRAFRDLDSK